MEDIKAQLKSPNKGLTTQKGKKETFGAEIKSFFESEAQVSNPFAKKKNDTPEKHEQLDPIKF